MERTVEIGRMIGSLLGAGDIVALNGELGAGKTQMVRGIAEGLGADPRLVSSPTYVMIQEYPGRLRLYHLDAYRIHSADDLESLGWPEIMEAEAAAAIEWPGRLGDQLPVRRLDVQIDHLDMEERLIRLTPVAGWEIERPDWEPFVRLIAQEQAAAGEVV